MTRRQLLLSLSATPLLRGASAPGYGEHDDLLYYLDGAGERRPVRTEEDWLKRRGGSTKIREISRKPLMPGSSRHDVLGAGCG